VTIGSVPPLNAQSGTFTFDANGPALKLQCKLDSAPAADCTSPVPVSGLAANVAHTFSVRAVGLDNVPGAWTNYTWTIDIDRPGIPTITGPSDNLLTSFATPTFSGSAEPGTHVPIFDGSTQIANPTAGLDGRWSFTPSAPLADGSHLWRVRAIDAAGNRGDFTTIRTLRIDTQAPAAPVVATPTEDAKLTTRTPLIAGTGEPQTTIAVSEGATRICSTAIDPNGTWSCLSAVSLIDGPHEFHAVSRDGAGNESAETIRSFAVDATPPPAPTLLAPADGTLQTSTGVTVSGTATPLATVMLWDGFNELIGVSVDLAGNWSHDFTDLPEADYAFRAQELDDFGNRSGFSSTAHLRIDHTAPVVTIATHPAARTNQTHAAFTLTASETGVDFECDLDDAGWQACDTPDYVGLGEGAHELRARATDAAGNPSESDAVFSWTIDLTAPLAPFIDTPAEGITAATARPVFNGHAEPGATVEVFVGAASQGTVPASSGSGSWTLTPGASLAQGTIQATARTIDAAGNVSPPSAVRTFVIDSVAPTTTIQPAPALPTNAASVTINFSASEPGASFICSLDNAAFAPCASPLALTPLSEGSHTLRVRSKDAVGNVESPTPSVSFRIDRTAPVGHASLIAGSENASGNPVFAIGSDDSEATAECKLDNDAYTPCSGRYRPAATPGIHALTIRFTDVAGNVGDQVIAFGVTPAPVQPPPDYYQQEPPAAVCQILGAAGSTSGKLKILSSSGTGRALNLSLSSGSAALVRVDAIASGSTIGSSAFAVKGGTSKLVLKLKRAPLAGKPLELAVRFYSVKREYGTAHLALKTTKTGFRVAPSVQSTLDVICPNRGGKAAGAKFAVTGAGAGKSKFTLTARGKRPALIALKLFRAGASKPLVTSLVATPPAPGKITVKLPAGAKLEAGGYKFTFDALSADGVPSSGRGAFAAR
jgi:hypothetical protein